MSFVVRKGEYLAPPTPEALPEIFVPFNDRQYESFLTKLERNFLPELQLLKEAHLFPDKNNGKRALMNPFLTNQDAPIVTNVGPHCVAVAYVATQIAEIFGLTSSEQQAVTRGGILHNLGKGIEVWGKVAAKAGADVNPYASDFLNSQKTRDALKAAGYSESLISQIAKSGVDTGHVSLANFARVSKNGQLELKTDPNKISDLTRMIIHLADDMVCSPKPTPENPVPQTYITTPAGRMIGSGFMFTGGYPFLYFEGLHATNEGVLVETGSIKPSDPEVAMESNEIWKSKAAAKFPESKFVDTFASIQVGVSDLILQSLASRLPVDNKTVSKTNLGEWLVQKINHNISESSAQHRTPLL